MSAIENIVSNSHERVSVFTNRALEITAIIAVHDTTLGPALGGCRIRNYPTIDEALYDVLRLAESMTYKNSLAGLNIGGGKAVIVANRNIKDGRREVFEQFGHWVNTFGGSYISAEDMGTTVEDIETMHTVTKHVSGCDPAKGGGGNPSPHTARGVFDGIRACLERKFGTPEINGRHVAIQGVGAVGMRLARMLAGAGAVLTVADTSAAQATAVQRELGAHLVDINAMYDVECDVFSPCAVGAIINGSTIPRLKCSIIAGAANNQLEYPGDELQLAAKGILYAPDFAINAGGVILCADEIEAGGFNAARVDERVGRIGQTVGKILDQARATGTLAGQVALNLARARIEAAPEKPHVQKN